MVGRTIDRDERSLHDRMKAYEAAQGPVIDPDLPWIVRVGGKAFRTWTRGLARPFSPELVAAMNEAARVLSAQVQGASLGYVQSDEITIAIPARANDAVEPWFGGKVQKIVSVAASCAASVVTLASPLMFGGESRLTMFDARAFNLPSAAEAANCLVWRQQDAIRNSVSAVGQAVFSHRQLQGVSVRQLREKLSAAGSPWEGFEPGVQRGRWVRRRTHPGSHACERHSWIVDDAPKFTDARAELLALLTRDENGGV
jgi:tRNA(His) 5'-end guanylyltransferase